MRNWLRGAAINTDRNLRLQYLAGLGLNLYQSNAIYQRMIADVRYPDGLFTGMPQTLDALRQTIERSLSASRPGFTSQ
jgi:spermidine synthase